MRVEMMAAPTSAEAVEAAHVAGLLGERRDRDDQRQLGRAEEGERAAVAKPQHAAVEEHRRHALTTRNRATNSGSFSSALESLNSSSRLKAIPLVTKKNGIRNPYPTAVSFDSKTSSSCPRSASRVIDPGDEAPEQQVEAELGRQGDQPEYEHDRQPHRELAARLEGPLEERPASPCGAHGQDAGDHRERDEEDAGSAPHAADGRWRGPASPGGSARTRPPSRPRAGRGRSACGARRRRGGSGSACRSRSSPSPSRCRGRRRRCPALPGARRARRRARGRSPIPIAAEPQRLSLDPLEVDLVARRRRTASPGRDSRRTSWPGPASRCRRPAARRGSRGRSRPPRPESRPAGRPQ